MSNIERNLYISQTMRVLSTFIIHMFWKYHIVNNINNGINYLDVKYKNIIVKVVNMTYKYR